jgi:IS30 family transposase
MAGRRLDAVERAQIAALFARGFRYPEIAAVIGRDRTTVWRELGRNNSYRGAHTFADLSRHPGRRRSAPKGVGPGLGGSYRWAYSAVVAQRKADARARRPRPRKLVTLFPSPAPLLWELVHGKLVAKWSPRQVSAWLRDQYPDRPEFWVSHETIYQAIYFQARGQLRRDLAQEVLLRSGRARRRPQARGAGVGRGGKLWAQGLNISTRPAEAADRAVPGHWEGDLIIGARNQSAIITLVERSTRFVMLGALPEAKDADTVAEVLTGLMRRLPEELRRTLAWDQGSEMARHAAFTLATGCPVFFCDPHSPWQRGSNENTNGLLRQYFPRSTTNFRDYSQNDLDEIAEQLNGRPRETLGFANPAEKLNELLIATTT